VDLKTATDVVDNIVTSSAVVIGGVWAYFKFVRGRTFARRAELDISPALEQSADSLYLAVTITLKNTGLSKLPLNKDMKVVRKYSEIVWLPMGRTASTSTNADVLTGLPNTYGCAALRYC
jgi:hypothetical protein